MFWALIIGGTLIFIATAALVYSHFEAKRLPWHIEFAGSF